MLVTLLWLFVRKVVKIAAMMR